MSLKKRVLASTMLSAAMGVVMGGAAVAQVDRIVVTATKTEDARARPAREITMSHET